MEVKIDDTASEKSDRLSYIRSSLFGPTCEDVGSGKLHQWMDFGSSAARVRFKFWYSSSQKNGVNGAMSCMMQGLDARQTTTVLLMTWTDLRGKQTLG